MNFEDFYLVLKEKRIEKGYSQKQLGEKCGLSQQAINRIEHGLRGIDIDLFFKICKILDINIPELMGYEYQGGGFYGKEAPAEIQKNLLIRYLLTIP